MGGYHYPDSSQRYHRFCRSNFRLPTELWGEPVILVLGHGVGGRGGSNDYRAHVNFEFWNRRKYPIVIRFVELTFGGLPLGTIPEQSPTGEVARWYIFRNKLVHREEIRLDPAKHELFHPETPINVTSLDSIDETVEITVFYFDPISSQQEKVVARHRYNFPQECY